MRIIRVLGLLFGFALSQSDEERLRNSAFATEENEVR